MFRDDPKPFLDHLEDLRWMILKSLAAIVISMGLCLVFAKNILNFLQQPLFQVLIERGRDPHDFLFVLDVVDPLTITIQTSLTGGLIIACPFVFFFIAQFILPALTVRERKMLAPAFISGGLLFLGGAVFCYYLILPKTISFFIDWGSWLGAEARWPLQNYIGFVLQMLSAFGVSFELPLLLSLLAKLGIVTRKMLADHRRHAFVAILFFAACATPTSDPFSLFMLTGPMYFLYEVSIFIAGWIERDRARQEALENA